MSENRQNVDALVRLLREAPPDSGRGHAAVAEFLASRGCLVPSAMTDEQVVKFSYVADGGYYSDKDATSAIVGALERIAKGEPDGG